MAVTLSVDSRSPYQRSPVLQPPAMGGLRDPQLREFQEEQFHQEAEFRVRRAPGRPVASAVPWFRAGLFGAVPMERQMQALELLAPPEPRRSPPRPQAGIGSSPFASQTDAQKGWLTDALKELEQIDREAKEEGFPPTNELSRRNARRIVIKLAEGPYSRPAIYPTADGEIAILFQKRNAQAGVLILCDRAGGAACFSTIGGKKRRARYEDASDLPDAFVKSELQKLRLA